MHNRCTRYIYIYTNRCAISTSLYECSTSLYMFTSWFTLTSCSNKHRPLRRSITCYSKIQKYCRYMCEHSHTVFVSFAPMVRFIKNQKYIRCKIKRIQINGHQPATPQWQSWEWLWAGQKGSESTTHLKLNFAQTLCLTVNCCCCCCCRCCCWFFSVADRYGDGVWSQLLVLSIS